MSIANKRFAKAVLAAAIVAAATTATAQQKEDWHPSQWGKDDQIGAANRLSNDKVLEAVKLVKEGKTYSLGINLNKDVPAFAPRSFNLTVVQPNQQNGGVIGPKNFTYNDEILHTWLGIGTQLDGLGHVGIDGVYYNGFKAEDFAAIDGLKHLGVEKIPPIVTRGVLLDMTKHFNTDMVKEGTAFNRKEIEAAAQAQGVEIREGDVVLFHTGWLSLIGKDNERFASVEPGLGVEGAQFLADKGVVAIGADTWALEVLPGEEGTGPFEVHQILLAKNGVYILENINTHELAADGAKEFLFMLGHPKIEGAVQSIINPVAIR